MAIETRSLGHRFGDRIALDDVSLSIEKGTIFGLLGPNGSGKTTLFRILTTLLVPTSGSVTVAGFDPVGQSREVRRRIGVVFQKPSVDNKLTVTENLAHHARLYGGVPKERFARELARFDLADRANDYVETLSGGLRRRVELAKSLLTEPEVLLMDEPSSGLDPGVRRDLMAAIEGFRGQGITTLLTTHLMDEAERCDQVAILDQGRVVAIGAPDALKAEIGADIVTIRTGEPVELQKKIKEAFGGDPMAIDGVVRVEREAGHEFVPELVRKFPDEIEAVTIGKPTLEDVYLKHTGHRFDKGER